MSLQKQHTHRVLSEPVKGIRPSEHPGADALLRAYCEMSFQARSLGQAADLLTRMATQPGLFKVLTLAGALVPGGMSNVIREMIEHRIVDAIISTGANMSHDLVEAFGHRHYRSCNLHDDIELREAFVNRIYDTFLGEEAFYHTEERLMELLKSYQGITSADLTRYLGLAVEKPCILRTAAEHELPIFVPALNDSELGIAINRYNRAHAGGHQVRWDGLADNMAFAELIKSKKEYGIIICGGGVPRNWAQQVTPLLEYLDVAASDSDDLERKFPGYQYGIHITTDTPVYGGMSGCTFSESISWGKYDVKARYVTVNCDVTIALPLIVAATIARIKSA